MLCPIRGKSKSDPAERKDLSSNVCDLRFRFLTLHSTGLPDITLNKSKICKYMYLPFIWLLVVMSLSDLKCIDRFSENVLFV